jgi:hypothetical protein
MLSYIKVLPPMKIRRYVSEKGQNNIEFEMGWGGVLLHI